MIYSYLSRIALQNKVDKCTFCSFLYVCMLPYHSVGLDKCVFYFTMAFLNKRNRPATRLSILTYMQFFKNLIKESVSGETSVLYAEVNDHIL